MDHLSGRSSNKENNQFTPIFEEHVDNGAPLSSDLTRSRGCIRSHEEALAELRRENFRLRLLCYNYEQVYKKSTNPQDFESSRLFAAEVENNALKEAITEKHSLLNAASKMIDALKEENDMFEAQLRELKERFDANEKEWRSKYDALYQELEESKGVIRNHELQILTRENEAMRRQNELQSRIAELEFDLESAKSELDRKQSELDTFHREADQLRLTLEQVEQDQPRLADAQAAAQQLCDCMSISCQKRVEQVTSVVHVLLKQIREAGLTPQADLPQDHYAITADDEAAEHSALTPTTRSTAAPDSDRNGPVRSRADRPDDPDPVEPAGDSTTRVAYLSQRLNSARQLLLEIGNEKLRQDKLISRMRASNEREQQTLREQCRSVGEQLEKQKQLHSVELTRRDDEIQRLHQRVSELVREIDNLTVIRGSLMSDVDKAREQISRLQWEHTDFRDKLNKELREKQRVIQHLQIALSTMEVGDVTQFSVPDEARLHDSLFPHDSGASATSAHADNDNNNNNDDGDADDADDARGAPRGSNAQANQSGDQAMLVRKQLLSISHQVTESHSAHGLDADAGGESIVLSEVYVGRLGNQNSRRRRRANTYSLESAKPLSEIAADSQGSRTGHSLDSNTNTASLASDQHVTSLDLTKDVAQLSICSSSAVDSFADLPTVSTPPSVPDSPDYADASALDAQPESNRSPKAADHGEPSRSSRKPKSTLRSQQRGVGPTTAVRKVPLTSSGIIHSTSVGPLVHSVSGSVDSNNNSDSPGDAHGADQSSLAPEVHPKVQQLCEIRELYQLIHNLKLQLDCVRFTEHSFVEMVNRSLSTAGINASFQISPQKTRGSLLLNSEAIPIADAIDRSSGTRDAHQPSPSSSRGRSHQNRAEAESRRSQLSTANATYGGAETLLDDLDSDSCQPARLADQSYLSASGINMTVAELRTCPDSPNVAGLRLDDEEPGRSGPRSAAGPGFRPSRLPKARGIPSNLIGSASICEETDQHSGLLARVQPLSVSFTAGDIEDHESGRRAVVPQHSAIGDLTMVEWQNKDLFERLSQATARLRDALEECADVSSELWTGDVSQRLLTMLSSQKLDVTQPHESADNLMMRPNRPQSVAESDDKTPEPVGPKPDLDISGACFTQNRSVRFDQLHPVPPVFEPITPDVSLSQLYGSAWRSHDSVKPTRSERRTMAEVSVPDREPIDSKPDLSMLQRFVGLLTQALSNVKVSGATAASHDALASYEVRDELPATDWLPSWVQSASHWFQSYLDVMVGRAADGSHRGTAAAEQEVDAHQTDINLMESMLECLERVYHDRVEHLVGELDTRSPRTDVVERGLQPLTADGATEHEMLSKETVSYRRMDETVSFPDASVNQDRHAVNRCVTRLTQPVHLNASMPNLSRHSHGHTAARHLEDLSRLAEQLSSAQDTISRLEQERRELLGLLPCTATSLTELAAAWTRLTDEQITLERQLKQSVPSEQYHELADQFDRLRTDLLDREKQVTGLEQQLVYFMERFNQLDIACESADFACCVDACFSELLTVRATVTDLQRQQQRQQCELAEQLETTKHNYDQLHEQFNSLQSEFQVVNEQLNNTEDRLEQIEQLIFSEFPEPSEYPLVPAAELLIREVHELRDAVDQLTQEQQTAYALLHDLCDLPESGSTLSGCVEAVRQAWNTLRGDLAREVADKDQALDLMRGMNLATVHDPSTLFGYVQACLACLTAKQDEINRLGLLCERTEESLRNTVPMTDYEDLKAELARINHELSQSQNELLTMESQLNDVVKSSVPFETYESKLERVAALEQELADSQAKQAACDHERQEVISLISDKTQRQISADNWVEQIGLICDEFVAIQQSMNRLHTEYEHVLDECQDLREQVTKTIAEMEANSAQVKQEHEAALAAVRNQLDEDFAKKIQAATDEHTSAQSRLTDELDAYRRQHEELNARIKAGERELADVGRKLHEAEQEIGHLKNSIAAHAEAAKAATETSRAQEQRANELASHLECLRAEHRNCPARLELVNVQTSPVGVECPTAEEFDAVATLRPTSSAEMNEARVRKYGELKAVAFEIKEKLIRRTDKLEAALTEVARLRSVIQQDKEHASRILEEVEDLRKQAVRKNKRIHELETELAQLKAAARVAAQPVSSARNTRSSARTVSEVEQPRGAQCPVFPPPPLSERLLMVGSTTASLLHCPNTPSIDDTDVDTDSMIPQLDVASVQLDPPGTSPQTTGSARALAQPSRPDPVEPTRRCDQCEKLHNLVLGMKRLTVELQRRVQVDLREEYSLLATLDAFDVQPESHRSPARDALRQAATASTCSLNNSNPNSSLQPSMNTSLADLRSMVKSLHHTRSRLKYYAQEMDRICGSFIRHWNRADRRPVVDSPSQSQDEMHAILSRSLELLQRVHRRAKAFFKGLEVSNDMTARELICDVHSVIEMLQLGREPSSGSRSPPSPGPLDADDGENKENARPNSVEPAGSQTNSGGTRDQRRSAARAERYYRRYRDLAQGLDTMTKELTETNNVLAAARSNLERTTGLSVLSNTATARLTKTWSSPSENPDFA